jgi:glycosyltransferase involved in cell wall biosynthesis
MFIERGSVPCLGVKTPLLSIVIPTHNRPDILKKCLEHIAKQTIVDALQVIVVHDGEGSTTKRMLDQSSFQFSAFSFQEIPKSQQGVARNRGVEKATAPIVLFGQDDIFFAPDVCEKHLIAHSSEPAAVLGFTTWDPACGITDVMRWLEKSGWQFGYPMIEQYAHQPIPKNIQHRFTYTSHISLPTEIAKKFPFREDVSLYGWEDILWGTELRDAGVQLIYEPDAKALHHHHIELEDSLKRMKTIGQSLKKMEEIDPSFDRIPHGWKLWAHQLLALMPTMRGKHEQAFLAGLRAD